MEESAGRECYLELHTILTLQGKEVWHKWGSSGTDLNCSNLNSTNFTIYLLTHYRYETFHSECVGLRLLEHNAKNATGSI